VGIMTEDSPDNLKRIAIALAVVIGILAVVSANEHPSGTSVSHPQASSTVEVPADTPKPKATNAERDNYAQELERSLLSRGLDATVRAVGKNHDTLRISWAAMSRPVVYNMMTSEGMVQQVPQLGFTRVILTDDGSFSGENTETWRYRWNGSAWIR